MNFLVAPQIKVNNQWFCAENNNLTITDLPVEEYQGFFGSSTLLGRYPNLATVKELAKLIKSHGELASLLYCHTTCIKTTETLLKNNNYLGIYRNIGDFAQEFYEKYGYSSEIVNRNEIVIDWELTAELWLENECFLYVQTSFNQYHVFFLKTPFGF